MNKLWIAADTHFDHANVIKHSGRPFRDVEEMNEALIENWNANVRPQDTVWFLGDLHFRSKRDAQYWLSRLHGHIHVVLGNHDDPKDIKKSRAASVQDVKYLRHEGRRLWLSHYCHRVWKNSVHGSIHLFGHSHGDILVRSGRLMDVGVDAVAEMQAREGSSMLVTRPLLPENYRPISFEEVVVALDGQPATDHHEARMVM